MNKPVVGKTLKEVKQKADKAQKKNNNNTNSLKSGDAVSLNVTQDGETNIYKGQVVGDKILAVRTISKSTPKMSVMDEVKSKGISTFYVGKEKVTITKSPDKNKVLIVSKPGVVKIETKDVTPESSTITISPGIKTSSRIGQFQRNELVKTREFNLNGLTTADIINTVDFTKSSLNEIATIKDNKLIFQTSVNKTYASVKSKSSLFGINYKTENKEVFVPTTKPNKPPLEVRGVAYGSKNLGRLAPAVEVSGMEIDFTGKGGNIKGNIIKPGLRGEYITEFNPEGKAFGLFKTPTVEVIKDARYLIQKKAETSEIAFQRTGNNKDYWKAVGYEYAATPFKLVEKPVESTIGLATFAIATGAISAPLKLGSSSFAFPSASTTIDAGLINFAVVGTELERREGRAGTKTLGETLFFSTPIVLGKAAELVRQTRVTSNAEFVDPELVFDKRVLQGKDTFPMSRSAKESLIEFRKAKGDYGFEVSHATSANIKNEFTIDLQPGTEGAKFIEDPGLFVTPKGRGSPYFTRVGEPPKSITEISIFPKFERPSVLEITNIKNINRLPMEVLETPGFEVVGEYYAKQKPGDIFISKRSEIGLGTVKGKGFKGTGELEAIIPTKTELVELKNAKRYTVFEDVPIELREFRVTGKIVTTERFGRITSDIVKISASNPIYSINKSSISLSSLPITSITKSSSKPSYITSSSISNTSSSISTPSSISSVISTPSSVIYSSPKSSVISSSSISRSSSNISKSTLSSISRTSYISRGSSIIRGSSNKITSSYESPPPPIEFNLPKFKFKNSNIKSTQSKKLKFKSKYTPSLEAGIFGVKGKRNRFAEISGLGIRKITPTGGI